MRVASDNIDKKVLINSITYSKPNKSIVAAMQISKGV